MRTREGQRRQSRTRHARNVNRLVSPSRRVTKGRLVIAQSEEILRDARNVGAPSPQTGEKGFSVVRFNISTSAATCLGYNTGLRKRNVDLSQISHGISQVFKVRRSLAVLDDNALEVIFANRHCFSVLDTPRFPDTAVANRFRGHAHAHDDDPLAICSYLGGSETRSQFKQSLECHLGRLLAKAPRVCVTRSGCVSSSASQYWTLERSDQVVERAMSLSTSFAVSGACCITAARSFARL